MNQNIIISKIQILILKSLITLFADAAAVAPVSPAPSFAEKILRKKKKWNEKFGETTTW